MAPDLLETIYEAALTPSRWPQALEQASRLVGAAGGQLLILDERSGTPHSFQSGFHNPDAERLYAAYYGGIDPRREHAMTRPVGEWMACHHVFDDRFVARSEFYQDYMIPEVGSRYMAGVRLAEEDGMHAMFAVGTLADGQAQPFGPAELRILRELTPHLARSARLQTRIQRLEGELAIRDAALDRLLMAVMIVDQDATLRYANVQGEAVLQIPNGPLACRSGRLDCRLPRQASGFAAAVAAAVKRRLGNAFLLQGAGDLSLNCVVVPLSPRLSLSQPWQKPMAMLVFTDPGAGFPVDAKTLQSLFGLTPAESRLATGLAAGQSLEAYAIASGISPMTARAQLRAVFGKVGVHRQAELVAILQRVAQVRPAEEPTPTTRSV